MSLAQAEERNRWFSIALIESGAGRRESLYSTHALLLQHDTRIAFCAGAWLSVIALCFAAIEAQYRQVHRNDYEACAHALFGNDPDLDWLRRIRNEISHAREPGTASDLWKVAGGDIRAAHDALEKQAKRAIRIAFHHVYVDKPVQP